MNLTDDDIQSFIEMWEKEFGERLTPEVAESEAKRLLNFFLDLAEAKLENKGKG